ncbi:hypothetical protein [Thermosipho atlanticus]|uniref:Uncharacterized protein n=1 Tax=Thermosipho atlanticus DSM 15807 TaxID=1123380 RepID=A0A1M5R1J0_9BACT|nr:hypothetical protein [Thermosipho atlanticus]SHH20048.1 hypothetical protein SAMN02745199_0275 [Thermosipho atlanticus DSM 15807]
MIYDPEFLDRYHELQRKRSVIISILKNINSINLNNYKILIKNLEGRLKDKLKKLDISYFSLYTANLLYGKGALKARLNLFEEIGIMPNEIAEILFWANPQKYPFPNFQKKYSKHFIESERNRLKKSNLDDFLQLYALDTYKNAKNDFLIEIITEINSLKIYEFEKITWLRELIFELNPISRQKIKDSININEYIEKALFSKPVCEVILDGNNIIYWTIPPSLNNIEKVIWQLSQIKKLYFPFYIVFDKNVRYMYKSHIFNFPNVYFHSPADELIINLAISKKAKIISRDKFRDWDVNLKKYLLNIDI